MQSKKEFLMESCTRNDGFICDEKRQLYRLCSCSQLDCNNSENDFVYVEYTECICPAEQMWPSFTLVSNLEFSHTI